MEDNPKMSIEDAFNMMVQACRSLKLSYTEHQRLNEATQIVLDELNNKVNENEDEEKDENSE